MACKCIYCLVFGYAGFFPYSSVSSYTTMYPPPAKWQKLSSCGFGKYLDERPPQKTMFWLEAVIFPLAK